MHARRGWTRMGERARLSRTRRRRTDRAQCSGFTLTELMIVVVIVAVLATLAVAGVRGYMVAARRGEAAAMIQSIRTAQEAYRAETNAYLDVSSAMDAWYPRTEPDQSYVPFAGTGNDHARWRLLNPTAPGQGVRWVYVTKAGAAGTIPPNLNGDQVTSDEPLPRAWYVIQAMGDTDNDGHKAYMAAASISGTLFVGPERD